MPIYNQPGSNTGLVVHVGGATTTVAPVIGGKAAPGTIQTCQLAGNSLNQHTKMLLLQDLGFELGSTTAEMYQIQDLKEEVCYVV